MAKYEVRPWSGEPPALAGLGAWYQRDYLTTLRQLEPRRVELFGIYAGEQPRLFLPLYQRGGRGLLPALAAFFGPSPLAELKESAWLACVEALTDWLRQRRLSEIRFILPPSVGDVRPFLWNGWEVTPRYTYLVEPVGAAGYSPAVRRQLKKAVGLGLAVQQTSNPAPLYQLYSKLMRRQGLPCASRKLVESLAAEGEIYEARRSDGSLSAAVLLNEDDGFGYYTLAASAADSHGDGAPSLLVDHLLTLLQSKGKKFDFVGANTPRLCRFKRGFGGALVGYYQLRLRLRPVNQLLSTLYRKVRRGKAPRR